MFGWYTRFSHTYQASKSMTAPLLFRLAKPSAGFAAFSGADAGAEEPQVHSVKRPQWSEGKRPKPATFSFPSSRMLRGRHPSPLEVAVACVACGEALALALALAAARPATPGASETPGLMKRIRSKRVLHAKFAPTLLFCVVSQVQRSASGAPQKLQRSAKPWASSPRSLWTALTSSSRMFKSPPSRAALTALGVLHTACRKCRKDCNS
mmetsp:Transcript_40564/g.82871  ORF Transcript_40564/g.82871 Transcript_40564/m.82871 type:complete len:209 (+) Transcript_40564:1-627(+)